MVRLCFTYNLNTRLYTHTDEVINFIVCIRISQSTYALTVLLLCLNFVLHESFEISDSLLLLIYFRDFI